MSSEHRLQREEETVHAQIQGGQARGTEFSSVEELLRFDAAQNPPPPAIGERLNESVAAEPQRPQSWLKRLFGGAR